MRQISQKSISNIIFSKNHLDYAAAQKIKRKIQVCPQLFILIYFQTHKSGKIRIRNSHMLFTQNHQQFMLSLYLLFILCRYIFSFTPYWKLETYAPLHLNTAVYISYEQRHSLTYYSTYFIKPGYLILIHTII